jgi:phenylpropionate dioxygenase-like ring-hydroxylating dioxygenase large terminal subunit
MTFSFDPHIETAETLPARMYTDPVVLELEKPRVFGRARQLVGRLDQVTTTGDFFTAEIGDEAIVVARDGDQLEDIAICEALQKNLRSTAYERGRYSVRRENGVHHFHGLLHEFLARE